MDPIFDIRARGTAKSVGDLQSQGQIENQYSKAFETTIDTLLTMQIKYTITSNRKAQFLFV
jgi:hypothetical protein